MIHLAARLLHDRLTQLTFAALAVALVAMIALSPRAHRHVVVTDTTVEILDDVTFIGTDTISTRSLHTLDMIANTLIGNPSITLVEVQANTEVRAKVAMDYLIGQGVEPARLTYGPNMDGNPRASFLIVKRDTDSQP